MAGKDKTLQVKLYDWQMLAIDAAAARAGKTRSDWCREALDVALKESRRDQGVAA